VTARRPAASRISHFAASPQAAKDAAPWKAAAVRHCAPESSNRVGFSLAPFS